MRFCRVIIAIALFVGAVVSNADIIHNTTNLLLGDVWQGSELFDLDVNSDGVIDFSLSASLNNFSGITSSNPDSNKYLIHPSPPPNIGGLVASLDFGYLVDSNSGNGTPEEWFALAGWDTLAYVLSTGETGEFLNGRGYVGLEFEAEGETHYGWLDLEGMVGSQIMVHGWAYESTPGVGVIAGAVPEPSSAILFTIGAIGAWTLRKRKNR